MKRVLSILLLLCLMSVMVVPTFAAEEKITIYVNSTEVSSADIKLVSGTPYVTAAACLAIGSKSCDIQSDGDYLHALGSFAKNQVYAIVASKGNKYINVNGRYLYIPKQVQQIDGKIALPLSAYAKIFGGAATRSSKNKNIFYLKTGSIDLTFGSEFYNDRVVKIMARTIYSEAGNQSLEGKIAVGNVICNRVWSPRFPNTVSAVVLEKNQFSGTQTHYFNEEPPESCYIAAKLALEGVEIYSGALYFNVTGMNTWACRNRKFLGTLGDHDFFQ